MGAYPIMYALLDVQRTAAGLPSLVDREHFDPAEEAEGSPWWMGPSHRRVPLVELAAAFVPHLAWLNERRIALVPEGDVTDDADDWSLGDPRVLKFEVGGPWDTPGHLSVVLREDEQLPLTLAERARWAVAAVHWSAPKRNWTLPEDHPAHATVVALLAALQPVSAFVTLDTMVPSDPFEAAHTFPDLWAQALDSSYLGPERLQGVPPDLLTVEAGLACVTRLGGGVWLTVPGGYGHGWPGGPEVDGATLERHQKAILRVSAALPPLPLFQDSAGGRSGP